jgi:hypothetical protein
MVLVLVFTSIWEMQFEKEGGGAPVLSSHSKREHIKTPPGAQHESEFCPRAEKLVRGCDASNNWQVLHNLTSLLLWKHTLSLNAIMHHPSFLIYKGFFFCLSSFSPTLSIFLLLSLESAKWDSYWNYTLVHNVKRVRRRIPSIHLKANFPFF